MLPSLLMADPSFVVDAEPNDQPAQAQRVAGEAMISGELPGEDQDGYRWTVSDEAATTPWSISLEGLEGGLTRVDVLRLEWTEDGQAVAGKTRLVTVQTRDALRPTTASGLLFEPGEYLIGVSKAGAEGGYRLSLSPGTSFNGPYDLGDADGKPRSRRLHGDFRQSYFLTGAS